MLSNRKSLRASSAEVNKLVVSRHGNHAVPPEVSHLVRRRGVFRIKPRQFTFSDFHTTIKLLIKFKTPITVAMLFTALATVVIVLGCTRQSATESAASAAQQTPKPLHFTNADLQKLRWIEGSWRGTGVDQPAFFERYRFENESTLAIDGFDDETLAKVTDTTLYQVKDGEFGGGSSGSRYVATALDDNSITFEPVVKARNSFTWRRDTKDSWTAILKWPSSKDKPAGERIYKLERWPKP